MAADHDRQPIAEYGRCRTSVPTVLEWHISARSVECSQELSALVDAAGWHDPLACLPSLVSLGPNGPITNEATRDDFDWEMVLAAGPYAPPSDQAQPRSMFWEQSDACRNLGCQQVEVVGLLESHVEELVRRMERHHIGVFEVRRAAIVYRPPRYETDRARPDGEDEPLGHR